MNVGDIIRTKNCKDDLTGVIVEIINEYAQFILTIQKYK